MNFIGCDPGAKGSIAVITSDGGVSLYPFSKEAYINFIRQHARNSVAIVEKVHAMPRQGVTSMFSFGENFGWIQGVLEANGVKTVLVPPQTWKKHFGLTFPKGTDKRVVKQASIERAKTLFPCVPLRSSTRCRVDSDGLAEALLIALYGKEMYQGKVGNE